MNGQIELEEEGGITEVSLRNIDRLTVIGGRSVRFIIHHAEEQTTEHYTEVYFDDGSRHVATGFASGYLGEGPRGLAKMIRTHLFRFDIATNEISGWRKKSVMVLWGKGIGKPVRTMTLGDNITLEVW